MVDSLVFLQRITGGSFYDRVREVLVSVFGKVTIYDVTVDSVKETPLCFTLRLVAGDRPFSTA